MNKNLVNIGICDDNIRFCSELEKVIIKYCEVERQLVNIEIYYSGDKLYEDLKKETIFDILFLDIELGGKYSGVDIGCFIRNDLQNEAIQIIYISSYDKYALKLFKTRPMDFLIKPVNSHMIYKAMKMGIDLTKRNVISFQYKQGRNWNKVYINSILYFKSKDREIEMVTVNGKITFYESLENIYEMLYMHRFFYVHKSYLVNYLHVIEFFYDKLIMSNKEIIHIAQTRRKAVREIQKEYLSKEIEGGN